MDRLTPSVAIERAAIRVALATSAAVERAAILVALTDLSASERAAYLVAMTAAALVAQLFPGCQPRRLNGGWTSDT
jgi:hypothetical protein